MSKKLLPLSRVYSLLEPGPVVMVTTIRNGRPNIMTMSWHTMIEFEPPARRLCDQRPELHVRHLEDNQRMRHQHPDGGVGDQGGGLREHIRGGNRQVRDLSPEADGRRARQGAANRRVLCEPRM